MNNNKSRKKEEKFQFVEGERYKIEGKVYEILEVSARGIYAIKIDENGNDYGRAIILGSVRNKEIEKISE